MCLHTPCLRGCPNEDDPCVVLYCDFCHKAIIDCEIYTELPSKEVLCEECKVNMNPDVPVPKDELLRRLRGGRRLRGKALLEN
jgi:hypothetical protein